MRVQSKTVDKIATGSIIVGMVITMILALLLIKQEPVELTNTTAPVVTMVSAEVTKLNQTVMYYKYETADGFVTNSRAVTEDDIALNNYTKGAIFPIYIDAEGVEIAPDVATDKLTTYTDTLNKTVHNVRIYSFYIILGITIVTIGVILILSRQVTKTIAKNEEPADSEPQTNNSIVPPVHDKPKNPMAKVKKPIDVYKEVTCEVTNIDNIISEPVSNLFEDTEEPASDEPSVTEPPCKRQQ